jgi:YYY domain-containing protein
LIEPNFIIFSWWFFIEIIGIVTVPITLLIFHRLFGKAGGGGEGGLRGGDGGYCTSKLLGIILVTYFSYILGRFNLLPFTRGTIFLSFILVALISAIILRSKNLHRDTIISTLKSSAFKRAVIKSELIFLVAFLFFLGIRAYVPDIKGGETAYDLAYLNTLIRTNELPPTHPWFSQVSLENYYYFGHFLIAVLSKFSGISANYSYNLGLVTIMALTCLLTFGLTYNLTRKSLYALIAIFLVAFSGNIFSFLQVVNYVHPEINTYVKFYEPPKHGDFFQKAIDYNWWHPSRIIPWAIHEMPYWTFIWGDLHGHFIALPLRLLIFTFLLNFFLSRNSGFRIFGEATIEKIFHIFFLAVSIGFIFPTNIYDFPFIALIIILTFILHDYINLKKENQLSIRKLFTPLLISLFVILLSLLLYSPVVFQLLQHIQDPIVKILPHEEHPLLNTGPPNSIRLEVFKTSLYHFLLVFSLEVFLIFLFLSKLYYELFFKGKGYMYMRILFSVSLLIYLTLFFSVFLNYFSRMEEFYSSLSVNPFSINSLLYDFQLLIILIPIIGGSILLLIFNKHFKILSQETKFVLFLILSGALIALLTEIVNVEGRYVFMNKIYGEIYILWGISSAYILYFFGRKFFSLRYIPITLITIFLLLSYTIFPILTTIQKTNVFKPSYGRTYLTLDGYDWLERERHEADYEAIKWLNKNVNDMGIILEVPGRDYQYTSRISVFTGLPTVLGWIDHMELHLAISRKNISKISHEIDQIYDTKNNVEALMLLKKYNVEYIYVGELEHEYKGIYIRDKIDRKEYSKEGLEKFDKFPEFYEKIYDKLGVKIYKVL